MLELLNLKLFTIKHLNNNNDNDLYFKIGSVCLCVHLTLYAATDCIAATDISGVSGRWQLSR